MILQWCGIVSTFLLFSTLAWRMLSTPKPQPSALCRAQWLAWGSLHLIACLALIAYLLQHLNAPPASEWTLCLIRGATAFLLMPLWRGRRSTDR